MGVVVGGVGVPGSTGNFSVSGLPFQPVAVVFFNQHDQLGVHSMFYGCATAGDEQWVFWTGTNTEISGYTERKHEGRTDRCCLSYTTGNAGTIAWAASLVSLDASGFTLNLTERSSVSAGEGSVIYYMALGGDHIFEAYAGTFLAGDSTGTVGVTAPGFEPTAVVFGHNADAALDGGANSVMIWGMGVADANIQYSGYVAGYTGTAVLANHIHRTDSVACAYQEAGSFTFHMALDSLDANGFTVDVNAAWPHTIEHGYLAINAEGAVAGYDVQPDGDTTLTYNTPGLLPEGVFFLWPGVDAPSTTGSNVAPLRPGSGAGTISQERMSSGIYRSSAGFGVFTSDGYQIGTEPMGFWGVGGGIDGDSNDSQASANISSLDAGSFDLTWTSVADTNDRAFGWLALPGELIATWIPQSYRRR